MASALLFWLLAAAPAPGGEAIALESIEPDGIGGALLLCGGGRLPDSIRQKFIELAGGRKARLVVIPTASEDADVAADSDEVVALWKALEPESITVLHTRDRAKANDPAFVAPLADATAVWISGGRQSQIAAAYSGTRVEGELKALVARGGVVGGTSAGAACQTRVMIVRGRVHDEPGLGLLPRAIVDQHYVARGRQARLRVAVAQHPDLAGFGIDEGTALLVRGRSLQCLGDSTVTVCLSRPVAGPRAQFELRPGDSSDLTMLLRAARDAAGNSRPFVPPGVPEVQCGSLVIAGGGRLPPEVLQRFIELAGGPDAPLVVLPTALPGDAGADSAEARMLEGAGARRVTVLPERRRADVESEQFLGVISEARGVWFGGGRQWRFVDAYEGTRAAAAFRELLDRGGVIGGSSAGATIQGECLVRGSPLGNEQMLAPGYERGFAFLPGSAIDQHFAQRQRFADMTKLVAIYPQILGVGIDEGTALIVRGRVAEVTGAHQVHFFDRARLDPARSTDFESVPAGGQYDLVARRRVDGR